MADERSSVIIAWITKILLIGLVAFLVYGLQKVAVLAFIALILASAVRPVVTWGKKIYLPAAASILLAYALLFTAISVLLSLIIPPLAYESSLLVSKATVLLGVEDMNIVQQFSLDVNQLTDLAQNFERYNGVVTQLQGSVQAVLGLLTGTFSLLFVLFSLLVIAFHMLQNIDQLALSFAWVLPRSSRADQAKLSISIIDALTVQLGAWVRGQLLLMFVIGFLTYVGLLALGVPYALPLALLAGFLEFIPNLGPTIATIPTVIVAFLMVNPLIGFLTLAFCIMVQQVENNFIVPGIMKNAVDVQPLTTILLLLIGFESIGVLGAVISVPLYVAVRAACRLMWPDSGPFASYTQFLPARKRKEVEASSA